MSELSPALAAALALTAKHLEPIRPETFPAPVPAPKVEVYHKHISRKALTNRKRNKLAAKSRKRNRR